MQPSRHRVQIPLEGDTLRERLAVLVASLALGRCRFIIISLLVFNRYRLAVAAFRILALCGSDVNSFRGPVLESCRRFKNLVLVVTVIHAEHPADGAEICRLPGARRPQVTMPGKRCVLNGVRSLSGADRSGVFHRCRFSACPSGRHRSWPSRPLSPGQPASFWRRHKKPPPALCPG